VRGDRLLGGRLQPRLERRVDLEPAVADGLHAVTLDQLLLDVVEEVLLRPLLVAVAALEAEPVRERLFVLLEAYVALLIHRLEDVAAAAVGTLRVEEGVVVRRRLRQAGEQRRLAEVEV
jgi:hypothetical protein